GRRNHESKSATTQRSSFVCDVERSRDILDFIRSSTCSLNESTGSAAYFLRHARFGRHKFRGEPRKQSNQIVRDQNLSVAVLARADPDRRDADCIGDLLSDIGQDNLEHHGKCSDVFHRTSVRQQCFDCRWRAALDSVAALRAHTLRQHADVPHKRYSRARDRLDLSNMTHTTFELHRLRASIDKFSGGLHGFSRGVVSVNRHVCDEQRLFDPPRGGAGVMQHFVQCYICSVPITQNYHAYRIAHEDDVDATLIEQPRGGIIVRRKRGNSLAALLHLAKISHGRRLERSAADFRTQAVAKSGAALPLLHRSIYQFSAKRRTAPDSLKPASKSLTVFLSPGKTKSGRISPSGRSTNVLRCSRGCGSCNRSSLIRWSPQ